MGRCNGWAQLRALPRRLRSEITFERRHAVVSAERAWRRRAGMGVLALGAGLMALGALAPGAEATPPRPQHKITLCHRTDSYTNPYVVITVDVASVQFEGHDGHDGPVFYPTIPKHQKWGDIIPPFDFGPGETYPGKNWTVDGIAIYNNGCAVPPPTTTTTTTTTTVPPTTTSTSTPTSTSVPSSTTAPSSTTTSLPLSSTTTPSTTSPSTTVPVTVTTAGGITETTLPGATTTSTAAAGSVTTLGNTTPTTTSTGSLPRTGASTAALLITGLGLVGAGFGLMRRRAARV